MKDSDPLEVALRFVEQINRQNLEGLVALMSEDHTFIDLAGDVHRGRELMRQGWADYFAMCPDYMIHLAKVYAQDETAVLVGRTTGSHLQLPRAVEFADPAIWTARIVEGQVAEWRIYPHRTAVRAELGIGQTIEPAAVKPTIAYEALERIDIRVGTIVAVEEVPRSKKLVKLHVSLGDHSREILAGLKGERDDPREIEGRQALFVVNLEPRRMAGELSQGMLFDLGYADGITPVLAVPERPVPDGTRAG